MDVPAGIRSSQSISVKSREGSFVQVEGITMGPDLVDVDFSNPSPDHLEVTVTVLPPVKGSEFRTHLSLKLAAPFAVEEVNIPILVRPRKDIRTVPDAAYVQITHALEVLTHNLKFRIWNPNGEKMSVTGIRSPDKKISYRTTELDGNQYRPTV